MKNFNSTSWEPQIVSDVEENSSECQLKNAKTTQPQNVVSKTFVTMFWFDATETVLQFWPTDTGFDREFSFGGTKLFSRI